MSLKKEVVLELKDVPKTEIHLHIEAVTSANTVWKLIKKHNLKIKDVHTKKDLEKKFHISSLGEFIDLFINIVQSSFKEPGDFNLLMDDLRDYLIDNGIIYTEVYLAPTTFLKNGFDFKEIIDILQARADEIQGECGIDIRFLIDVSRGFGLENALNNLELTIKNRVPRVIGIGLGGAEKVGKAEDFKTVFDRARLEGLHTVAHAGEDADYTSIEAAIDILGAERIGHGISAIENTKFMDRLKDLQIPLEICPTSNIFTGAYVTEFKKHPVKQFYNHGIYVTINSDDPTLFGSTLLEEYGLLVQNKMFTKKEIGHLILNNLRATFLTKEQKDRMEIKISETLHNKGYL